MPPAPLPPPPFEPAAWITRRRWAWEITITDGLTGIDPGWMRLTRAGAERCARRKLAWYRRTSGPPREQHIITEER